MVQYLKFIEAMKLKYYIIIVLLVVSIAGGLWYLKSSKLKKSDPPTGASKSKPIVDLRPLIAKKLQQLVKEGSDGLYNLKMEKLVPDVLQGELDIYNASLTPDSAALKKLDSAQKAPDDIFKISLKELHIDGITINDILNTDKIEFDSVFIKEPVIEAFHDPKNYNKAEREKDSSATLYQRLMKQVKSISINAISVDRGTFITNDLTQKDSRKIFTYVSMHISKLLIDSTTQYDKDRFLFAKKAELSCKDYTTRTADSLYLFKIGYLKIQAHQHSMTAEDVAFIPRGDKHEFEKKLRYRGDRYDMRFPKIIFKNVDWWAFANNEHFFSKEADVYNARIGDYIDAALPEPSKVKQDNFISQLLMRMPVKVNVEKANIHRLNVIYEQYNPSVKQIGRVYFNDINGIIKNITNNSSTIKQHAQMKFSGSGLFMHKIPVTCTFQFDLSKYKSGNFSIDINIEELDKSVLNPFTEPLSFFAVKSGTMQQGTAHVEGNNFSAKAKVHMLYTDLHLTPLKKDKETDSLKKKTLTGFIANAFLIKNNNPSRGEEPRNAEVMVQRKPNDGFFNLVWKTMLTGILKIIGIPEKYADKK